MVYPADEETFDNRVSPEFIKDDHLNAIQAFLKRIQDFLGYGGRLNDETGLVMPVGSVIAFTGDSAPSGWYMCDGKHYKEDVAANIDLFAVIGYKYGNPFADWFNVPDFRGNILRGGSKVVDLSFVPGDVITGDDIISGAGEAFNRSGFPVRFTTDDTLPAPFVINTTYYTIVFQNDNIAFATSRALAIAGTKIDITTQGAGNHVCVPWLQDDKDTRLKLSIGGNDGEDIGSYQGDALQGHNHKISNTAPRYPFQITTGGRDGALDSSTHHVWTNDRYNAREIYDNPSFPGAVETFETRPKNVAVNYIIKR